MLSILIPVYNYDVRELVETLHRQTEKMGVDFEILLADDASTDQDVKSHNKAVCLELPNCHYNEFSENRGRTYTRHYLAEKAHYQKLLFLDADVLPRDGEFVRRFLQQPHTTEVAFGGITYVDQKPPPDKMLRWTYGRARETKSVERRRKSPYLSIISGAFYIRKSQFLKTELHRQNAYGLDILFVQRLKRKKAVIRHLDNPVIHMGLESNRQFLAKTKSGLRTLVALENQGEIALDYRPVQKAYLRLKKLGMLPIFDRLMRGLQPRIEKNLLSAAPSLFWFDLFKLQDYLRLKK